MLAYGKWGEGHHAELTAHNHLTCRWHEPDPFALTMNLPLLIARFPRFAALYAGREPEHVLPPASESEILAIEDEVGVPLPDSYKAFLACTRGLWLMDGVIQFGRQHPFVHQFEPLEALTPAQQRVVAAKGGEWPPPSQGMLCFAEFFMEADGDQVLFDTRNGLQHGEYPVVYYAHEGQPPSVRVLAASFLEFIEGCLEYPAFQEE